MKKILSTFLFSLLIFFVVLLSILIIPISAKAVMIPICPPSIIGGTGEPNTCTNPTLITTPTQTPTPAPTPTTTYTPNYVSTCTCPDVSFLQYQTNNLLGRVANLESSNTNLNTEITDLKTRLIKLENGGNGNSLDVRVSALEIKYTALYNFVITAFTQILQAIKQLVK